MSLQVSISEAMVAQGAAAAGAGEERMPAIESERLRGARRGAGPGQFVEAVTDMRPAEGQAHGVALGQRPVSGAAVDVRDSDEALAVPQRLLGLAVRRVETGDARRIDPAPGSIVACIGEQPARLGAAAPGIEHRAASSGATGLLRTVGEELAGRLQPFEQPLLNGPEQEGRLADPPEPVEGLSLSRMFRPVGTFPRNPAGLGRPWWHGILFKSAYLSFLPM